MRELSPPRFISLIRSRGFTLVELLVSMTVLSIIMMVATSIISQIQKTWVQGNARMEQFREARTAFDTIVMSLSQATLNSYTSYQYNTGETPTIPSEKTQAPIAYLRHSELQFVTGPAIDLLESTENIGNVPGSQAIFFQAPLGNTNNLAYKKLNELLCGCGYFIVHGSDSAYRPAHITQERVRFRLMEFRPPSERNEVYSVVPGQWFRDALSETITGAESVSTVASTRPVAENIVALIIAPRLTPTVTNAAKNTLRYQYDSAAVEGETTNYPQGTQHLLPPEVQVTLVAIDERSASRLAEKEANQQPQLIPDDAFVDTNKYDTDLASLEERLTTEGLTYRVFTATVGLRNAKWGEF